ncbi:MAG: M56 family metallopeptidase, partial [Planctomycetota bacterium]
MPTPRSASPRPLTPSSRDFVGPVVRADEYAAETRPRPTRLVLPGEASAVSAEQDATGLAAPTMESEAPAAIVEAPSSSLPEAAALDAPPAATESRKRIVEAATSGLSEWAVQLETIRRAVMSLPPLPLGIWAGGAVLTLLVLTIRVVRSIRLVRRGRPASVAMEQMVVQTARSLGLRRVPRALMIDGRFAPMIWCGREACLVLPSMLWEQLDEPGRRAVVMHELAHLRRHDHWVSWVGLLLGSAYWWHPVVWWVRRRLRDEADLCCDAWVTCLLPTTRRAYAQALLETRRFTSARPPLVPAVGLGASTARTKRFARRLTMVMTEPGAPRTSRRGLALVWTIALTGVLVTPLLACPPEKKDKPKPPPAPTTLRLVAPPA